MFLIVDEIGGENDCAAILEAVNAGITLVMTTHGLRRLREQTEARRAAGQEGDGGSAPER